MAGVPRFGLDGGARSFKQPVLGPRPGGSREGRMMALGYGTALLTSFEYWLSAPPALTAVTEK